MKGLRDIKVLQKSSVMDDNLRFAIAHHVKNYIDLDTTQSEKESSSSSDDEDGDTARALDPNNPANIARNLSRASRKKSKKAKETAKKAMTWPCHS